MKILRNIIIPGGLLLFLAPVLVFAGTYQYVDTNGNVQVQTADTPEEALAIAPNRAPRSGVMEVGSGVATTPVVGGAKLYAYITVSGSTQFQSAHTPEEAMTSAPNRDPRSGVMLVLK